MCPRIGWWAGCVAGLGCGAGCHSKQGRLIQPAHLSPPCRQGDPSHPPPAAILLRGLRKVFPSRGGGAAEKARRHRACCPPFAAACWRCASCRIQLQLGARVTDVTPPPPLPFLHRPSQVAVADLSLAIPRSQCFGLLGPNGAGKTTAIRIMEGFLSATSGQVRVRVPGGGGRGGGLAVWEAGRAAQCRETVYVKRPCASPSLQAFIEGLDIRGDMDGVYALTGACPQHDLLWESLTGEGWDW